MAEKDNTLRELITQGFNHLTEKIGIVQNDVEWLKGQIQNQQQVHLACLNRQNKEKSDMWAAISEQQKRQAESNGIRKGEEKAREQFDVNRYIAWGKVVALGTVALAAVTVVFHFV